MVKESLDICQSGRIVPGEVSNSYLYYGLSYEDLRACERIEVIDHREPVEDSLWKTTIFDTFDVEEFMYLDAPPSPSRKHLPSLYVTHARD